MPSGSTLPELLRAAADEAPDADAFRYRDERLRYADWHALAERLAGGLAARGVGRGDVVALLLPSTPLYPVAYLAAARLGAVTTGINVRYRRTEIGHVLSHLRGWMRPQRRRVNLAFLPARAEVRQIPLGVVGVMGAWNYPVNLTLVPLVAAIAAGNHVLVKPSEHTPRTALFLPQQRQLLVALPRRGALPAQILVLSTAGDRPAS